MTTITGNTYPVKERFKALGGRWNPNVNGWDVPDNKAEEAKKLVTEAPVSERQSRNDGSQTKRCWECGCAFTYGDAKRNDGDWQDSYCGC